MPALNLDITIEQGATFQREFTVVDADGAAFPLTGYTIAAVLETSAGTEVAVFTSQITSNKVLIELADEVTALLPATTNFQHHYRVKATSPAGVAYRIAQGQAVISEG